MKNLFYLLGLSIIIFLSCEEESPTINYPISSFYGDNILAPSILEYSGETFSLSAELKNNAELKVVITAIDQGIWYYSVGTNANWAINNFDFQSMSQTFNAINTNQKCELSMLFDAGSFKVDYYENGSSDITNSKIITKK